ncbi:conserved membrane protein of unknown function [Tenacibaculum sp. 190524A02b]|uniref:HPP transmembrane region domain-containing protein n=1 Tax=Tenacibaculum vairaonense TaxID=3137860 RepID=A0ABP1FD28_9FLAO
MIGLLNSLLAFSCFICIYVLHYFISTNSSIVFIAAFGASAVLGFSYKTSPFSFMQISVSSAVAAFIGVFFNSLGLALGVAVPLCIGVVIFLMHTLKISYPPAGAIAIIPLLFNKEIEGLGFWYVLYPTLTGVSIIYAFSIIKKKLNFIYNDRF